MASNGRHVLQLWAVSTVAELRSRIRIVTLSSSLRFAFLMGKVLVKSRFAFPDSWVANSPRLSKRYVVTQPPSTRISPKEQKCYRVELKKPHGRYPATPARAAAKKDRLDLKYPDGWYPVRQPRPQHLNHQGGEMLSRRKNVAHGCWPVRQKAINTTDCEQAQFSRRD